MISAATQTRNSAFFAHRDSGGLNKQQTRIMLEVHAHPGRDWSLRELAIATHFDLSAVSGRCTELKALGYLEECPARSCSVSGRTVTPVRARAAQGRLL